MDRLLIPGREPVWSRSAFEVPVVPRLPADAPYLRIDIQLRRSFVAFYDTGSVLLREGDNYFAYNRQFETIADGYDLMMRVGVMPIQRLRAGFGWDGGRVELPYTGWTVQPQE